MITLNNNDDTIRYKRTIGNLMGIFNKILQKQAQGNTVKSEYLQRLRKV